MATKKQTRISGWCPTW